MSEAIAARPPGWFRLLSVLALLWSAVGFALHLQKLGAFGDPLTGLSDAERALAASVPAWVNSAFSLAIYSALLGAFSLLLLKRWAILLLRISLLAVLVQCGWILFLSDARAVHGLTGIAMPALVVLIGVLQVWLANEGGRRGWLN